MTTAKPTFSICIPNYNNGPYIGDTIQSVLDQTYQEFEIVIADNASTDNSIEVIEQFKDPRIRLYRNNYNIGFAPNLQRVTMHAQNDFINLLSADDQMKPQALETYAQILIERGQDAENTVLFSQVENFDNNNNIVSWTTKAKNGFYNHHSKKKPPSSEPAPGNIQYQTYRGHDVMADSLGRLKSFGPFLSIVYPRKLWEAVEGYNGIRTIGPDKHFNFKLLGQNPTIIYVEHVLYRYREHLSLNRATQRTTLKQPIDDYLYTIEYRDDYLKTIGLTSERLINTFIDRVCLKESLSQFGYRNYRHAFQLFAFAMSSYPGVALRNPKTYVIIPFLLMGPLANLVAPIMLSFYHRQSDTSSQLEMRGEAI